MRMQTSNSTIGGAPDEQVSLVRGTGAGQWSFQLVDERGTALPKQNGTKVDVVKVDTRSVQRSTICVKAVYEDLG